MEPRIQYAKTEDGVSIAYASMGEGPTLVMMPTLWEQFSLALQLDTWREAYESIGRDRQLILYDCRGFGMSQRDVDDFSLERRVADLTAVVDALELDSFSLFATIHSGLAAIAFAVQQPARAAKLILYGTLARIDWGRLQTSKALIELVRSDWDSASQVLADMTARAEFGQEALGLGNVFRQSADAENVARMLETALDVRELLSQVTAETLVVNRNDSLTPIRFGQELAASIPNAQLVPLEGDVQAYFLGDTAVLLAAIDRFLGDRPDAGEPGEPRAASGAVHTILFTDVEGSTALTDRLGDAKARELLREHELITREALKAHDGSEVKTMGDGFMASFGSATKALECAIAIQQAFAERNECADEPI